jgi:hypothetical protein
MRLVTHRHIEEADIERAIAGFASVAAKLCR